MKTQFELVQAFADAWTEGALATARMMEASTKSAMATAKKAKPKASETGWYQHPDQSDPMASMSDAMHSMTTSGLAWWSPEFWNSMTKRSPSTLQNMAEPAFGSFVGLDPFSPLLVWEHILPDLASPAGWSPANVFNPSNWFDSYTKPQSPGSWFGMPIPADTLSKMWDQTGRADAAQNMMAQWTHLLSGGMMPGKEAALPFMMPVANPWLDAILPNDTKTISTMFALPADGSAANPMAAWVDALQGWSKMVSTFSPETSMSGGTVKPMDVSSPAMWMNSAFPFAGSDSIKVFVASISIPDAHLRNLRKIFTPA